MQPVDETHQSLALHVKEVCHETEGKDIPFKVDADYVLNQKRDTHISTDYPNHYNFQHGDVSKLSTYALHAKAAMLPKLARKKPIDPYKVRPSLAWLPIDTIRHTLANTTQLASWSRALPLKRHLKARFHFLNLNR